MSEERTDNVKDLHLLACLVWPRDRGIVFRASSPSIAARIHSRAMFTRLAAFRHHQKSPPEPIVPVRRGLMRG